MMNSIEKLRGLYPVVIGTIKIALWRGSHRNGQLDTGPLSRQRDSHRVNSYSTGLASVTTAQNAMAGGMGTLVHKDHFHETYLAPQGKGRLWIHH